MGDVRRQTRTGGREATGGHIPGDVSLAVGCPPDPTPTGFRWCRLTDLARLETGHTPSRRISEYWDGGTLPWVGVRDATGNHGRVIYSTNEYITELGEQNSSTRLLPANTVCLSRTASVGYVVVMGVPMCTSQDFVNWVCGPGLDYRYLKYILLAEKEAFLRFASGTTHQTVYFPEVKAFHVMVPDLDEQRAIAGVLGVLDDKIESNRRIWRLRQDIAVSCFDLFRSKSDAEVPMGDLYRVGLSGVWGEELPTDSSTIETKCLRGRDLEDYMTGADCSPPTRFITNRQLQVRDPQLGEIWTAGSGSLGPSLLITEGFKKRWDRPITNSNFVKRLVPIADHGHHAAAFHIIWESWRNGGFSNFRTGTAMPNLDPYALLRGLSVPQLKIDELEILAELTDLALDSQLPKETLALANLRDALLPELLSGRIRVRDAEKVVEVAV